MNLAGGRARPRARTESEMPRAGRLRLQPLPGPAGALRTPGGGSDPAGEPRGPGPGQQTRNYLTRPNWCIGYTPN